MFYLPVPPVAAPKLNVEAALAVDAGCWALNWNGDAAAVVVGAAYPDNAVPTEVALVVPKAPKLVAGVVVAAADGVDPNEKPDATVEDKVVACVAELPNPVKAEAVDAGAEGLDAGAVPKLNPDAGACGPALVERAVKQDCGARPGTEAAVD